MDLLHTCVCHSLTTSRWPTICRERSILHTCMCK
ncbi:unnamed protein product [Spirodela intermedia]|uniref:Uncharacterized protein n=1 Tax=Spirodela intermedia TaxID=51605 RepID=A0A7I8IFE2_SPIIN|nr:unnamed protein product [Spirodela intermedia]CAA6656538.1 unnamed protein product [Spirodela intermedia]